MTKKKLMPKENGRTGALPPLDTSKTMGDADDHSSKRAKSLQEKNVSDLNAQSPINGSQSPQEINLTRVQATPEKQQVQ